MRKLSERAVQIVRLTLSVCVAVVWIRRARTETTLAVVRGVTVPATVRERPIGVLSWRANMLVRVERETSCTVFLSLVPINKLAVGRHDQSYPANIRFRIHKITD